MNFSDYQAITQKLLDYFENTGYPFAKVSFDSINVSNGQINAGLKIEKGYPYRIDSIRMYGPAKFHEILFISILMLKRGSVYNKSKLEKINQRLLELPYLEQTQPWDLNHA